MLRRVVVNLRENPNEGFRCVLWSQRGGWLTLRDVEALASGQPATKMIGDVVIHVDRVAFFEVVE